MLKQNISWTGHTGRPMNKTLYFNLTRFEVAHDMELEVLEERFKRFQAEVIGPEDQPQREMTPPEIREMLDMVKVLIKHSYGVRSEDGVRFAKNDEIWNEFVEIGAFDAFIFHLFESPERANSFMEGIWPEELRKAAATVRAERPDLQSVPDLDSYDSMPSRPPVAPDDDIPSLDSGKHVGTDSNEPAQKQWFEYNENEILDMSDSEFQMLVGRASNGGKNVPPMLLVMGQRRKQLDTPGGLTE